MNPTRFCLLTLCFVDLMDLFYISARNFRGAARFRKTLERNSIVLDKALGNWLSEEAAGGTA